MATEESENASAQPPPSKQPHIDPNAHPEHIYVQPKSVPPSFLACSDSGEALRRPASVPSVQAVLTNEKISPSDVSML